MEKESDIIVKIKFGDALRRIRVNQRGKTVDINMNELRAKVLESFKIDKNVDFSLTYVDQDKDTVMLVEDDDLYDALLSQHLNPLRVDVSVNKCSDQLADGLPKRCPIPLGLCNIQSVPMSDGNQSLNETKTVSMQSAPLTLCAKEVSCLQSSCKQSDDLPITGGSIAMDIDSVPLEMSVSKNLLDYTKSDTVEVLNAMDKMKQLPPQQTAYNACRTPMFEEKPVSSDAEKHKGGNASDAMGTLKTLLHDVTVGGKNIYDFDRISPEVHLGVQCDGCGSCPIVGPRYKSKVKPNYDLCGICLSGCTNKDEFTRIDTQKHASVPVNVSHRGSLDSLFVQDVTVLDGTSMLPLTPFTKIWKLRNNGDAPWPCGARLVHIKGDKLGSKDSVDLQIPLSGLPAGQELDVAVDFIAPLEPKSYVSYWRMVSPHGQKFGQCFWVQIQVEAHPDDNGHQREKDEIEKSLKLLEEMGFYEVGRNKDVLQKCNYDVEKCIEELCAFSEWDHLIDEMEEMGFIDRNLNEMLLKKNGGSIKKSVRDLVAGVTE